MSCRWSGGGRGWGHVPGPVGFIGNVEVGCFDELALEAVGLEEGVEEAAGEEGAFDGPGGLAGEDHLLGTFE